MLSKEEDFCVGLCPPFSESCLQWWSYLVLVHIVSLCWAEHTAVNDEGGGEIHKKTPSAYGTMYFVDMQTSSPVS